jgi:hypothetical protein
VRSTAIANGGPSTPPRNPSPLLDTINPVSRYDSLTGHLLKNTEPVVTMTFTELDAVVGGLPASARKYQAWWTNSASSQPHAGAWLNARRLAKPDFNAGHVVFTIGSPNIGVGPGKPPRHWPPASPPRPPNEPPEHKLTSMGDALRGEIAYEWMDAGRVDLVDGKLRMPELSDMPGIYRFSLRDHAGALTRSYVGEGASLTRRMSSYRNPGPTQSTNVRLNALLRATIEAGGSIAVAIVASATFMDSALDLNERPARLLIENAALVHLGSTGATIENL